MRCEVRKISCDSFLTHTEGSDMLHRNLQGILMHLCDIPQESMKDLHLPNGVPLVYNVRRKCISLLDDGSGKDPLEVYDFGSAAQYLFKPCEIFDDDFSDES